MLLPMLCGFGAAIINSAGYLFNARFLLLFKSPVRLLAVATFLMMLISLPLFFIYFPFAVVPSLWKFILQGVLTSALFLTGQLCFFAAMRYFEASRIASLLGLKIVVLSFIFLLSGGMLNRMQMLAVLIAAAAGFVFNKAGNITAPWRGWALILITLICYSLVDMTETDLVKKLLSYGGGGAFFCSFSVVMLQYSLLGILTMPALLMLKPDGRQLLEGAPYAVLWLMSQVLIFVCFLNLKPVFGNVILATRGIFSVVAGLLLPYFGLSALDSKIPMRLWIRRIIAALMMIGAIALYSSSSM